MRRMFLCGLAAFVCACRLSAQSVPARDLWEFPLGAMLEPAALALEPGSGLWNPAAASMAKRERWRLGVASLNSGGSAQGVDGQLLSIAFRRESGTTLGVSVASTRVSDITRTDTDPQSIGSVPYSSLLLSVIAAREVMPHVTAGVAMRLRQGQVDQVTRSAVAADLGIVVHSLPVRDARFGVSSFLWRPGREIDDRPALLAAADFRLMGETDRESRIGYSYNGVNRGAREHGPFLSWRREKVDLRAMFLQSTASGRTASRVRGGFALHYARFVVGLAVEQGISGLSPTYQFTLSSIIHE